MPTDTTEQPLAIHDAGKMIESILARIEDITTEEKEKRDALIAIGHEITKPPTDYDEQTIVLSARNDIKDWLKKLENAKSEAKRPADAYGKKILRVVEAAAAAAEKEVERLNGLINNFQKHELEKQRKAAEEAERERQRIANEQAAAQRAQEAAERAAKLAEAQALLAEQMKGKAKEKAEAEAARLAAEAKRMEEEAFQKALEAESAPEPTVVVPEGKLAKPVLDFEVLGESEYQVRQSLIAFCKAHPEMCKIEIKVREFKEAINAGAITEAPGVRIFETLRNLR